MKRPGPLRRTTPLRSRQRLAQRSKRRVGETSARSEAIRQAIARDGNRCWAQDLVPEVACWGPLDADEYDPRAQRPGGHLDPTNVQMLCRAHHDWKHTHPIDAARAGLSPWPKGYIGQDGHADRTMPR